MRSTDDPRNIFYNQRQEYAQETSQQQQPNGTQQSTQQSQQTSQQQSTGGTQRPHEPTYEEKVAEMKRLAAKYEREGEGQLVKDIVNNVIEQKASGNLSNEQLIAFAKRVSPLLNAEQRTRLNGLLEQLLKI